MEELIQACRDGDAEKVSLLVSNGTSVNTPYQGKLPLVVASYHGHTRIVEILLLNEAQVNLKDSNGYNALSTASTEGNTEVVKLLLDHDARVDLQDNNGWSALILASTEGHNEIVQLLLDHGAQVDLQDKDGESALISASSVGSTAVKLLLDHGAQVNLEDKHGTTSLIGASSCGSIETVRLLLDRGAQVNQRNKDGMCALDYASKEGHIEVVKTLLEHGALQDNNGWSALLGAVLQQHTEIVKLLLVHGAQIDMNMSVMTAAKLGGNQEIVDLLKISQRSADSKGSAAQDRASSSEHSSSQLVKHLLEKMDSMMEFQRQVHRPPAAKRPQLHPQNSLSIKDNLREVVRELLPLASQWKIIGTLLDVPQGKLDSIKYECSLASDCLLEMVKAWLKKIDPPPTWEQLVEAVEPLDPARAEAIRSKHCQP